MAESSRICVKNIGKATKEAELRAVFGKCGEITDLKIMRRPDGTSRNFAFIGYRTADQAEAARKYFNNTFMGLSRLSVSSALKLGELDEKAKLRREKKTTQTDSQQAPAKAAVVSKGDTVPTKASAVDTKPVSKKKEKFLELALGRSKDLVVAASGAEAPHASVVDVDDPADDLSDDDSGDESANEVPMDADEDDDESDDGFVELSALKPVSDLDYLRSKVVRKDGQEIERLSLGGAQSRAQEPTHSDDDSDDGDGDGDETASSHDDDSAVDLADLIKDPTAASKRPSKKVSQAHISSSDSVARSVAESTQSKASAGSATAVATAAATAAAAPNCRLYVTNLPYNATEEDVRQYVAAALGGDELSLLEVHLPLNKDDRRGRGFGFVRLASVAAAETVKHALHGAAFQGRVLHVAFAAEQQAAVDAAAAGREDGAGWSAFQKKKEEERRKLLASATNADRSAWNASYVRSDAVVDVLAQKYSASAGDLLDVAGQQGGDVAVRMALAETQVVMDNAAFLAAHGVSLDAAPGARRSDHRLLVKNLPADASADELEAMFARFGALSSFALAPSRTLAVAEFLEPSEARAAYKGLAYRRYRTVPLYLEWAPVAAAGAPSSSSAARGAAPTAPEPPSAPPSSSSAGASMTAAAATSTASDEAQVGSVFVKNLSFATDEAGLRAHLLRLLPPHLQSSLRAVTIQRKQKRADGPWLSLGYGFVELRDRHAALEALSRLHGSVLDEHALEAQLSTKRLSAAPAAAPRAGGSSKKPQTKLLVKNVAFQATKKELRDLFAAHGVVTSVRLPKTMAAGGSGGGMRHRGFAFVDFATAQEALNAKTALSHAHLYGRHLVIDFEDAAPADAADAAAHDPSGDDDAAAGRKRAARDAQLLQKVQAQHQHKRRKTDGGGDAMAEDAAQNRSVRGLL